MIREVCARVRGSSVPVKVLVANRGEIAVRIMRACHEMGLPAVAIYSDCDRLAPHVRYADEAVGLEADAPGESYLRIGKIIDAAKRTGADAVHPGYGFLAENAAFARAVADAGLTFIGPPADVIDLMGGKTAARAAAARAGLPIVPGGGGPLPDEATPRQLQAAGDEVGYPLFVKAVAGGGGKGMRLVRDPDALLRAIEGARSEAASAFGNGTVYLERCIEQSRHIEVQLLADAHGTVVPFVERECSIQRRHQKVIEESPSPVVSAETRRALAAAATDLAREVGYTNAGTIEMLYDDNGSFYFLEMNTRLQVEHPVTEMVTGIDLVHWQLRIAQGERLDIDPERALTPDGHAIECRVYAEDPNAGFMPCPGLLTAHRPPAGPGVRVDAGVEAGFEVPVHYDSMVAKLVAHASDRATAIARMDRALAEYDIGGVPTTIPLFRWLLAHDDVVAGRFDTAFLDRVLAERNGEPFVDLPEDGGETAILAAALSVALGGAPAVPSTDGGPGAGRTPRHSRWRWASRVDALR